MTRVLIVGFGRMGLSHSLQLSGLLGSRTKFFVVDPSVYSRLLARILLPNVVTFSSKSLLKKTQTGPFDFAVLSTPPFQRFEETKFLSEISKFSLVEKPVRTPLSEAFMSGYVMQHCPILTEVANCVDLTAAVEVVVSVNSNVDFTDKSGWRGNLNAAIANEFLGHALTFALTPIMLRHGAVGEIKQVNIVASDPNLLQIAVEVGDVRFNVVLKANVECRKTQYQVDLTTQEGDHIVFTPYQIFKNKAVVADITDSDTSVRFFLRGFEFARQAERLISSKGDVLPSVTIDQIDRLIDQL